MAGATLTAKLVTANPLTAARPVSPSSLHPNTQPAAGTAYHTRQLLDPLDHPPIFLPSFTHGGVAAS
jgi:hypothetical protein